MIYLITGQAARRAHRLSEYFGGDYRAATVTWLITLACYVLISPLLLKGFEAPAIALFIVLYAFDNVWSPNILSRYNVFVDSGSTATVLSIDSQANRVVTVALAPLIGWAVDHWGLWTVGVFGAAVAAAGLWLNLRSARHVAELKGNKEDMR